MLKRSTGLCILSRAMYGDGTRPSWSYFIQHDPLHYNHAANILNSFTVTLDAPEDRLEPKHVGFIVIYYLKTGYP
jgi:hypothetical protein